MKILKRLLKKKSNNMISPGDGKKLLHLAKDAVRSRLSGETLSVDQALQKKFSQRQGVFVTIHKNSDLRGCIGFPEPVMPLIDAIIHAAKAAAFEDPRFGPLQKEEFHELKFEMSVLTVPEQIESDNPDDYLNKIKIGEDGLIIRGPEGSGLLLPQVFTEYKCDPLKALEMTCQKAWLGPGSWKKPENLIFKFQAQIFSE